MPSRFLRPCVLAITLLAADARADTAVEACDALASVPMNANVDYVTQIQPIFSGCVSCHNSGDPRADLNLEPGVAPATLINVASSQNGSVIRVVPVDPLASLLVQKVNCEVQDVGFFRMPVGGVLALAEQALIYDWIAQGARAFLDGDPLSDIVFLDSLESERLQ